MDCGNMDLKNEIEWKLNNNILIIKTKRGSIRKGINSFNELPI